VKPGGVLLAALLAGAAQAGIIYPVAGTGTGGYNGDGIAATTAELDLPAGVAVDAAGNVYIADRDNQRIRMVDAGTGEISTIAGTGSAGYNFDGIPATSAQLNYPQGVAVDGAGNVYVADTVSNIIRKFTPGGNISTVAGSGIWGYNSDDIAATSAWLASPTGVAVDAAGNIYIAEFAGMRIRKVLASNGKIYTVAGRGLPGGYNGDGILATSADLNVPQGVAVDAAGNIFIADRDNGRVRRVDAGSGNISTVAGTGSAGYNGDGIPGTSAQLAYPAGVAVDTGGNVFIADRDNERVRRWDAVTGYISTVAGSGTRGDSGGNIDALAAEMYGPSAVCVHPSGRFMIVDYNNHRIRGVHAVSLVVRDRAWPDPVCPGAELTYTVSWSNAGWATAYGVTLTDTVPNGITWSASSLEAWAQSDGQGTPVLTASSYAASAAGPWTAGEPAGGAASPLVCRWVVDRAAPGKSGYIRYRVTVSSTLADGSAVAGGVSATVAANSGRFDGAPAQVSTRKAVLDAAAAAPGGVTAGQTFLLVVTVTNTGGAGATSVAPAPPAASGTGSVLVVAGPFPAAPVAITGGGSTTFSWTCSATGAGPVTFTLTVTGQTCGGIPVEASSHATLAVQQRAVLASAGVSVVPSAGKVGQQVEVRFGVSNTGGAAALVSPPASAGPLPPGLVQLLTGPLPPGPVLVAGGSATVFTWNYRLAAGGLAVFSVTVTGTDVNCGDPVATAGVSGSVTVYSGAALASTAAAVPQNTRSGSEFQFVFTVRNAGDRGAGEVGVSLCPADGGAVTVLSPPVPSGGIALAPGESREFTWRLSAVAEGTLTLSASATGKDSSDLSLVGTRAEAAVTVAPSMPRVEAGGLTVAPNRLDRSAGTTTVKIAVRGDAGAACSIEVYSEAGWRIRRIEVLLDSAGEGLATWDASDESGAPLPTGVYWVSVRDGGAKGRKPLFVVNGGRR